MRLVIDIPEEIYEHVKDRTEDSNDEWITMRAVANGTPLPKRHGRLGDLDALEKEIVNGIKAGNFEEGYETFAHINNMDDCVECVKYADTIISADTTRDCKTCGHSNSGKCAGTEECHDCMWESKYIEADKEEQE